MPAPLFISAQLGNLLIPVLKGFDAGVVGLLDLGKALIVGRVVEGLLLSGRLDLSI